MNAKYGSYNIIDLPERLMGFLCIILKIRHKCNPLLRYCINKIILMSLCRLFKEIDLIKFSLRFLQLKISHTLSSPRQREVALY